MLFKAPENQPGNESRPAESVSPLPPAAKPINAVAASYVKTPGVGGYVKMMYFNPNHGLAPRNPNSLPLPPAVPAVHPGGPLAGADASRSFVLPSLPGGLPPLGGRNLPPIAGPGLPPLPMGMPPHLMPPPSPETPQ